MINFISSWTGGIVVSVIISTILEMILPEGKNKKYIKTVIGVYILFSIISPIISKVNGTSINKGNLLEVEEMFKQNTVEVSSIDTSDNIEKIYIANLKQDIKNKLEEKGYKVNAISIITDNSNYGKINQINLNISKKENKNIVEPINKININTNKSDTIEKENLPDSVVKELQEFLSNIYDVEKSTININ